MSRVSFWQNNMTKSQFLAPTVRPGAIVFLSVFSWDVLQKIWPLLLTHLKLIAKNQTQKSIFVFLESVIGKRVFKEIGEKRPGPARKHLEKERPGPVHLKIRAGTN